MEWKTVKLGEVLNFRRGHDLPHDKMLGGQIPVAGSNGIIGYHNVATPIEPILTIGRSGNIGTPYFYKSAWAHNTTLYVDDFKGNDPLFLYYLCQTLPFASFKGGSAVPTLNRNHIHPLEIKYPVHKEDQQKISAILSSLDAQIENNNRINRNLEAQAIALFKSWFVDFEPWGGVMPDDWKEGVLGDIIYENEKSKIQVGQAKGQKGIYPFFTSGTNILEYPTALVDGRNIYLNTGGVADVKYYIGGAAFSTDTWCINGKNDFTDFLYLHLSRMLDTINTQYFEGSALKHLQKASLKDSYLVIPTQEIINKFNQAVKGLFDLISINKKNNKTLAQLRDTLLPKLMSGEIEV